MDKSMLDQSQDGPIGNEVRENGPIRNETKRQRRINLVTVTSWTAVIMMGSDMYFDTFNQWLYDRFQEDTLGENYTQAKSFSTNPCHASENQSDVIHKQLEKAQGDTALFRTWCTIVESVPALIVTALFGGYADFIGRKIFFIIPALGLFLRMAVTWAICYWHLNIYLMLVAMFLEGVCGSFMLLFMALYTYTADNTTGDKGRSLGMVAVTCVLSILYSLTHLATGYFITMEGFVWPFAVSAILTLVGISGYCFFLRETLQKRKLAIVKPITAVKKVFSFYFVKCANPKFRRKDFIILGIVFFMFGFLDKQLETVYLMGEPFCWTSKKFGDVATVKGIAASLLSLLTLHMLQHFYQDDVILAISLVSSAAGGLIMSFANADWMVYLAFSTSYLSSLIFPLIRAVVSKMAPEESRGSVLSSLTIIEVITFCVSLAGVNTLFEATVSFWRGLAYFVSGILLLSGAGLMITLTIMVRRRVANLLLYDRLKDNDIVVVN